MNRTWLFLVIFCLTAQCDIASKQRVNPGKSNCNCQNIRLLDVELWAAQLEFSHSQIQTKAGQKEYYCLFPNSFGDLNELFGYFPLTVNGGDLDSLSIEEILSLTNSGKAPLYERSEDFIHTFFTELDSIPIDCLVKKSILVALDGNWDVDAISIYQKYLQEMVLYNSDLYSCELEDYPDDIIVSFWYFFFDGPHPNNRQEEFEQLAQIMTKKNKRVTKLMCDSFYMVMSESSSSK